MRKTVAARRPQFSYLCFFRECTIRTIRTLFSGSLQYILFADGQNHHFCPPSLQPQTADQLALLPNTKFLARVYFDRTFVNQDGPTEPLPLFLAALSLAIKFNEQRSVCEALTPEALFIGAGVAYSRDIYFCLELKILTALSFRLNYTTPYDYLDIFLARFPFFPKMRQALPIIIEFASIQPASCECTSQELFFGAVLASLRLSNLVLSPFHSSILQSLTDSWVGAGVVKERIVQGMGAAMGEY